MVKTIEVRWFWPSNDIHAAWRWFAGSYQKSDIEVRTDLYLVLPGCEKTGVKLRDGNFEIKAQVEGDTTCSWKTGQSGNLQEWVKWSLADEKVDALTERIRAEGSWVAVNKARIQRNFTLEKGNVIELETSLSDTENTCSVEMTRVTAEGSQTSWLTLCFEAFGHEADVGRQLDKVVDQFFRRQNSPPEIVLGTKNSFSYPSWIKLLL